jgi:alpha-tubulin suppressor-like RCC1 family protein
MRTISRLAVMGVLVVSCTEPGTPPVVGPGSDPTPCVPTTADTVFAVYQDSMRLVVGSADRLYVEWAVNDGCMYNQLPTSEIAWIVRDTSVADIVVPQFGSADFPDRTVVPRAPGATVLVVEAQSFVDSLTVTVPDTLAMAPVTSVTAGGDVSCAVTEDDDVMCWGAAYDLLGQWETDPAIGTCFGSPCTPMPVPRVSGAVSVYMGANYASYACVLDASGIASCWGQNSLLQLGRTGVGPFHEPAPVSGGLVFTSLTLGFQHTCGVASDGAGYCWGDSNGGRLGGNHRGGEASSPVLVDASLRWSSIDARQESTCGATDTGHLYCWGILRTDSDPLGAETCQTGSDKAGPLTAPCSYVPLRMALGSTLGADSVFVQVSGSCALTTLGSLYCLDRPTALFTPRTELGQYASIASGVSHMCGLAPGGAAWCWGDNGAGQLGDGSLVGQRGVPVAVSGGHLWTQISAGGAHTCGVSMGEAWCWGATHLGQSGESILGEARTPVKVHGQD